MNMTRFRKPSKGYILAPLSGDRLMNSRGMRLKKKLGRDAIDAGRLERLLADAKQKGR